MITEDYVSFETAKLLKEKGFGGECLSMYLMPKPNCGMGNPYEAKLAPHGRDSHYYDGYLYQCEAPTLQMVMKWLREVHGLYVDIDPLEGNWCTKIVELEDLCEVDRGIALYGTYEEAAEAGIRYCLEMLVK